MEVTEGITKMRALALKMDEEVEWLSYKLRPSTLDDLGLEDALRRHVLEWATSSDMHTAHKAPRPSPADVRGNRRLPPPANIPEPRL